MAAAKLILLPIVLAPALRMTRRRTILMRDSSSVTWFKAGDRVRVSESVMSRGQDLRGRTGTVADAWEKCEEDPHCCCAELAEEAAAVTVDLDPPDARQYYFAEHELAKLAAAATAASAAAAQAAEFEPLLATEPRRDIALALVFPLVAYKAAAVANGNKLMPSLDATIAIACAAAIYYCI
jgi:hypothetical protein